MILMIVGGITRVSVERRKNTDKAMLGRESCDSGERKSYRLMKGANNDQEGKR